MFRVSLRALFVVPAAFVAAATGMAGFGIGAATADPCPDIDVVYARGTGAAPGIGEVGQSFVDALRARVDGRSVGVYAVNYPASYDFRDSASAGAADASAHVDSMAANCPNTKIVLGGTSQGAGVIALIAGASARGYISAPVPPDVADHVAAVAVFGNPTRKFAGGGPITDISPLLGSKTIDLCAGGDPFCSDGTDVLAHLSYPRNGMTDQAADFVAGRL